MSEPEWWDRPYTDDDWNYFLEHRENANAETLSYMDKAEKNLEITWLANQGGILLGYKLMLQNYLFKNRDNMHPAHIREMVYTINEYTKLIDEAHKRLDEYPELKEGPSFIIVPEEEVDYR